MRPRATLAGRLVRHLAEVSTAATPASTLSAFLRQSSAAMQRHYPARAGSDAAPGTDIVGLLQPIFQVTQPSDELPGASHSHNRATRFVPLPVLNGRRLISRAIRAPQSLGEWLHSIGRVPTGNTIEAKSGCSRGKQHKHCRQRGWCPASLVDLVLLSRRDGQKH